MPFTSWPRKTYKQKPNLGGTLVPTTFFFYVPSPKDDGSSSVGITSKSRKSCRHSSSHRKDRNIVILRLIPFYCIGPKVKWSEAIPTSFTGYKQAELSKKIRCRLKTGTGKYKATKTKKCKGYSNYSTLQREIERKGVKRGRYKSRRKKVGGITDREEAAEGSACRIWSADVGERRA